MDILFISSREGGDWGMDLLFSGLIKRYRPGFTKSFVISYPLRDKYRIHPMTIMNGDAEHDWGAERRSLGYVHDFANRLIPYSSGAIAKSLQDKAFDLIIMDERMESIELLAQVGGFVFDIPLAVIAGHDSFQNVSPELYEKKLRQLVGPKRRISLFLDNWRPEYQKLDRGQTMTFPYNWSINFDHLWDHRERMPLLLQPKLYDVCFMGYNSHPNREMYVDHINRRWGHLNNHIVLERQSDTFSSFVLKREYFEKIARSKICLNLRGAAENGKAMRFYEIPYVGSCMLSERWTGLKNHIEPPIDGLHYAAFSDVDELDQKIELLMSDDNLRQAIAEKGHKFFMENHVSEMMARDVVSDALSMRVADGQI